MDTFTNSSHEFVHEDGLLQSTQLEGKLECLDLSYEYYNSEGEEDPQHDYFCETDGDSSLQHVEEDDDDCSDEDLSMRDTIEYAKFGKWLQHDGDHWSWEEDVDWSSEMSNYVILFCLCCLPSWHVC